MYMVKRLLSEILERTEKEGGAIHELARDAMGTLDEEMRQEAEEPQEMRDVFAVGALVGLLARPLGQDDGYDCSQRNADFMSRLAWGFSDAMMRERRKRIGAGKAVQS